MPGVVAEDGAELCKEGDVRRGVLLRPVSSTLASDHGGRRLLSKRESGTPPVTDQARSSVCSVGPSPRGGRTKTIHESLAEGAHRRRRLPSFGRPSGRSSAARTGPHHRRELAVQGARVPGAGPGVLGHRGRRPGKSTPEPLRGRPRRGCRVAGPLLDRQPQGLDPGHQPPGLRLRPRIDVPHLIIVFGTRSPTSSSTAGFAHHHDLMMTSTPGTATTSRSTSPSSQLRGDDRFSSSCRRRTCMHAYLPGRALLRGGPHRGT